MKSKTSVIKREEIELYEITGESRYDFLSQRKASSQLSEFEQFLLVKIGDVLREDNTETFWKNGNYSWSKDENINDYHSIWLTGNGIPVLEHNGKLYHVALHES